MHEGLYAVYMHMYVCVCVGGVHQSVFKCIFDLHIKRQKNKKTKKY